MALSPGNIIVTKSCFLESKDYNLAEEMYM